MTNFPCPSCGKERESLEAPCECGWSPNPARQKDLEPKPPALRSEFITFGIVFLVIFDLLFIPVNRAIVSNVSFGFSVAALYAIFALAAFFIGQAVLIQIWAVFGKQWLWMRLAGGFLLMVLLYVVFMLGTIVSFDEFTLRFIAQGISVLPLYVLSIQAPLWAYRLGSHARIVAAGSPTQDRGQFRLGHLFGVTAAVGIALALSRFGNSGMMGMGMTGRQAQQFQQTMLIAQLIYGGIVAIWTLASVLPLVIWQMRAIRFRASATLFAGHAILSTFVIVLLIVVLGAIFSRGASPTVPAEAIWSLLIFQSCCCLTITLGLRITRAAGYRLEK